MKVFPRNGLPEGLDMSSRMRTLDRLLGLNGVLSASDGDAPFEPGESVRLALVRERERSLKWLESAIKGVGDDMQ